MPYLPIKFQIKLNKKEFKGLNHSNILDLIQNYLEERKYNYIIRKEKKITFFHANTFLLIWKYNSFLLGGTIKVKEKKGKIIIENGFWMLFILAIPFIFLIILSYTEYSTLDETDINIILMFFIEVFGVNLIIQILEHLNFKRVIKILIKENYHQTDD